MERHTPYNYHDDTTYFGGGVTSLVLIQQKTAALRTATAGCAVIA